MGIKQLGLPLAGVAAAIILPAIGLTLGWRMGAAAPGVLVVATGVAVAIFYRNAPVPTMGKAARPSIRHTVAELVRNRMLLTLSLVGFSFLFAQLALVTYLVLYLKDVALLSAVPDEAARIVAAGGYLAICHVGGACGRVFWGVVSDGLFGGRRAPVLAIIGGLSALVVVFLGMLGSGSHLWLVAAVAFGCGATALGWNGVYGTMIADTVGRKYAATGIGLSMTLTDLATIAAPPAFGLVVDSTGSYRMAWLLFSLFSAAGALVALALGRQERASAAAGVQGR